MTNVFGFKGLNHSKHICTASIFWSEWMKQSLSDLPKQKTQVSFEFKG